MAFLLQGIVEKVVDRRGNFGWGRRVDAITKMASDVLLAGGDAEKAMDCGDETLRLGGDAFERADEEVARAAGAFSSFRSASGRAPARAFDP